MLVSQRPSEIDPTILSQCGTTISLRLTNDADQSQVRSCASDNLDGLFGMLPSLRTGEALLVGEAVSMPVRALIDLPPEGCRPDSDDPLTVVSRTPSGERKHPGGWTEVIESEDYSRLIEAWRKQSSKKDAPQAPAV
jgi:DNA helicase HerA-like ATPase